MAEIYWLVTVMGLGSCLAFDVTLSGNTTVIPSNLTPATMKELLIVHTQISTFVLDELAPYVNLRVADIRLSPVRIVKPNTVPLSIKVLEIRDADYSTPPDIGMVKAQLKYVAFERSNIQQVPDDFFYGYSSLVSVSLSMNNIHQLGAGVFKDLSGLRFLHLTKNPLGKSKLDND